MITIILYIPRIHLAMLCIKRHRQVGKLIDDVTNSISRIISSCKNCFR
ncbi:Protein of unknown function [Lactobacillus delbrueckii subsp. bulgaricus]|nr:Protein of unknown function [Lactobacillus delbrueckii subsp. bulgaricus]